MRATNPKGAISRAELLNRYSVWLHMERRLLAKEMGVSEREIPEDRAANAFHFPEGGWESVPKPSTRAARVLETAGVLLLPDKD